MIFLCRRPKKSRCFTRENVRKSTAFFVSKRVRLRFVLAIGVKNEDFCSKSNEPRKVLRTKNSVSMLLFL